MDEKEHIRETRISDLQRFEEVSIISLAPLAIFSFMIGYFVSGRFLAPLKLLKKEIDEDSRKASDLFVDRYGATPIHPAFLINEDISKLSFSSEIT